MNTYENHFDTQNFEDDGNDGDWWWGRDEFAELEFPLNWTIWDMSDFFGHRTTSWALCLKIFENSSESFDQSIQIKFHHMNCKLIAVAINELEKSPKKNKQRLSEWIYDYLFIYFYFWSMYTIWSWSPNKK